MLLDPGLCRLGPEMAALCQLFAVQYPCSATLPQTGLPLQGLSILGGGMNVDLVFSLKLDFPPKESLSVSAAVLAWACWPVVTLV